MSTHRTQAEDLSPEAEAVLIAAFRTMPGWRKIELLAAACRAARGWAVAGLRSRHPAADERELGLRLLAQRIDRATMITAFGFDPGAAPP